MTSTSSLAALTRDRARRVSSRLSKSATAGIHASPTSVSSNVVANVGGIVKSDMRLDKGFSILCTRVSLPEQRKSEKPNPTALESVVNISATRLKFGYLT